MSLSGSISVGRTFLSAAVAVGVDLDSGSELGNIHSLGRARISQWRTGVLARLPDAGTIKRRLISREAA